MAVIVGLVLTVGALAILQAADGHVKRVGQVVGDYAREVLQAVVLAFELPAVLLALGHVQKDQQFAVAARPPTLVAAHFRIALAGFLGLTIVGATYQFYPPGVGEWPMAGESAATQAVVLLAAGLGLQLAGPYVGTLATFGLAVAALGALLHAYVVWAALAARPV